MTSPHIRLRTTTLVRVLYYSSYGHIEWMAEAVASGAREAGADVVVKRVPELVPEEVIKKAGYKLDQAAPIAQPSELVDYDSMLIGTPTRFGNMASQMKNFLDRLGACGRRMRQVPIQMHLPNDLLHRSRDRRSLMSAVARFDVGVTFRRSRTAV